MRNYNTLTTGRRSSPSEARNKLMKDRMEYRDLVKIATLSHGTEALVVKSLLASHGIHVVTRSSLVQSVHPISVDGIGKVILLVPQEDAERAREIIDEKGQPTLKTGDDG